uniref:[acyl-carrier-protein] S-malonyltransferase n=1 Tax=Arcella intermedia TaxID=1963864 RepID=A0A6B2LJE3_9EUKA|eukprot:TRINITY_DN4142_c0_g1_i4.p1 TRINITY_DN4142_c0_g1~~TRINITY_DN4142_c0_g1_i4.p1  ORF type:complete len:197 (-),score=57.22 TRINITY_DN4142_c0_g1_i4:16-606(-)
MQAAVKGEQTMMAALIPVAEEDAFNASKKSSQDTSKVCNVANLNGTQVVLSGHSIAVNYALALLKKSGKKFKTVLLNVSAPFHSELMNPVVPVLEKEFEHIHPKNPLVPFISNTTASILNDIQKIIPELVIQVKSPIKFDSCVRSSLNDLQINRYVEIGPKPVLERLVKKIIPRVDISCISTAEDITNFQLVKPKK